MASTASRTACSTRPARSLDEDDSSGRRALGQRDAPPQAVHTQCLNPVRPSRGDGRVAPVLKTNINPFLVTERRRTLADLEVGAEAVVEAVMCARPIARRLMEMGVLPGTVVSVVRVAPLGDPLQIELRSYSLSIRRSEAAGILLAADLVAAQVAS
jgi:ferrous iron transport protein A